MTDQPPGNMPGPYADPDPGKPKRKKWPWIVGAVVVLFVIIGVVNSVDESSDDASNGQESTAQSSAAEEAPSPQESQVDPTESVKAEPETTKSANADPGMTGGQKNAVRAAKDYLNYTAFSRQGLIDQLKFEDYSTEDATFAVDYVEPDWNEQAAKAAEDYLDYSAFSRQGLIDQLKFDGFTSEQAQYGAAQTDS